MLGLLRVVGFTAVCLTTGYALAQEATDSVFQLVEDTTAQVMQVVQEAESYVDDEPERYYAHVETILDPLIDYRGFARSVMGDYASSQRYRSLDEAGRAKLRDQLDRFTQAMRSSLVRTYSKGLLAFGSSDIALADQEELDPAESRVTVKQLISADRADPYEVLYVMGRAKSGDWQLRNVIIESVNLGEIYREQFLSSAREFNGDIDKVIQSWTAVTVDVEE